MWTRAIQRWIGVTAVLAVLLILYTQHPYWRNNGDFARWRARASPDDDPNKGALPERLVRGVRPPRVDRRAPPERRPSLPRVQKANAVARVPRPLLTTATPAKLVLYCRELKLRTRRGATTCSMVIARVFNRTAAICFLTVCSLTPRAETRYS